MSVRAVTLSRPFRKEYFTLEPQMDLSSYTKIGQDVTERLDY